MAVRGHHGGLLHARGARRGSVYLAVFALAMLALVIGLGGMMSARVQARDAALAADAAAARANAYSAIELGRLWILQDPSWRTSKPGPSWIASQPFGDGTISVDVTNPLGALARSSLDPVVMVGTGTRGGARQKLKVTLTPSPEALSCLNAAWCAGGSISVSKTLTGPGLVVATNASFSANSATVNADVEATGSVSGSAYAGSKKSGVAARALPSITSVLAEYALLGSTGSFSGIPRISENWTVQNVLIGPSSAPFGAAARANGVYILDCGGKALVIQNVRVVGTIVLVNCGGLSLRGAINWSPAVANYPCLIVQGSLTIDQDAASLVESTVAVNLNPSSTPFPYPSGTSNATTTDYYTCGINGLVYVSGSLTSNNPGWSLGPVIANGSITTNESVTIVPCPKYAASPPPGFADAKMLATAWEQAVD